MTNLRLLLAGAICLILALPTAAPAQPRHGDHHAQPLVIGHRGASGYRPEHTLASYRLAAELGADYIEPDLVSTKDGVLVARHENEISGTTDVAAHGEFASRKKTKVIDGASVTGWFTEDFTLRELKTLRAKERIPALRPENAKFDGEFASRKKTKVIDGASVTGWFTEDFTLRELKTLRAKERLPDLRPQNTKYDGKFEIPTFEEVLDLRARLSRKLHRPLGVYPETKHPTYFRSIGLPLEPALVRSLNRNGLNHRRAPVFVQSFETGNLRALDPVLKVPLVQLLDARAKVIPGDTRTYGELATPAGLRGIARYAEGVGPSKDYIVPRDELGNSLAPTTFVRDAHAAGLQVHPYTFRRENSFLPLELRSSTDPAGIGDLKAEIRQFFALGVDGVFTDNPDIGVAARRARR